MRQIQFQAAVFPSVGTMIVAAKLLQAGVAPGMALWQPLAQTPLLFFVGFMLTEPLTLAPRRWQQLSPCPMPWMRPKRRRRPGRASLWRPARSQPPFRPGTDRQIRRKHSCGLTVSSRRSFRGLGGGLGANGVLNVVITVRVHSVNQQRVGWAGNIAVKSDAARQNSSTWQPPVG